jgi:hypothetical protein
MMKWSKVPVILSSCPLNLERALFVEKEKCIHWKRKKVNCIKENYLFGYSVFLGLIIS